MKGKLLYCMMGSGKTWLSRKDPRFYDADLIYCGYLNTTPYYLHSRMVQMTPKQTSGLINHSVAEIKAKLIEGLTVLTGSYFLAKHSDEAYGYYDQDLLIERCSSLHRPNKRMISKERATVIMARFFDNCERHHLKVTDLGKGYLQL